MSKMELRELAGAVAVIMTLTGVMESYSREELERSFRRAVVFRDEASYFDSSSLAVCWMKALRVAKLDSILSDLSDREEFHRFLFEELYGEGEVTLGLESEEEGPCPAGPRM